MTFDKWLVQTDVVILGAHNLASVCCGFAAKLWCCDNIYFQNSFVYKLWLSFCKYGTSNNSMINNLSVLMLFNLSYLFIVPDIPRTLIHDKILYSLCWYTENCNKIEINY